MEKEFIGYTDPMYALSFQQFGKPRLLTNCGGWILERKIYETSFTDGMGCYPLFACKDWSGLHKDMEKISSELVSITLVTDPFGVFEHSYLERCFNFVKPFKNHYISNLQGDIECFTSKHHRYYSRKSLREVQIEISENPFMYIDDWARLYSTLIKKHDIAGIRTFSKDSFQLQLKIPGMILVLGKIDKEIIGGHLVLIHDKVAYSHLAAFSDIGYEHNVAYGIYWMTLKYLQEHNILLFDLGASSGLDSNAQDGLSRFKAGWSNDTRLVYFCGRTFDVEKYDSICMQMQMSDMHFFPAYRKNDF